MAYIPLHECRKQIEEVYENGAGRGLMLEANIFYEPFSIIIPSSLLIYAPPHTGKTQFVLELCIQLANKHKLRTAIHSPETGTASDIYETIIEMVVQKDMVKTYNNQMTRQERLSAEAWVQEYFYVIEKDEGRNAKPFTFEVFYSEIDELEQQIGKKISITVADHFGIFKTDWSSGPRDLVLQDRIILINENAKTSNRYNIVVTHVTNQTKVIKKGQFSYYPPPDPQETANGQEWYRLGASMIGLWRPPTFLINPETKEEYEKNCTVVLFGKQKPRQVKKQGSDIKRINYYWSAKRHRYYYKTITGDSIFPERIVNKDEEEKVQSRAAVNERLSFEEDEESNPFA